jgi:hypothetical protein
LSIFLRELLAKRYTNLSSDIISLLTGLDNVDAVFTDFVGSLDNIIKNGRTVEQRRKAIHLALTLACGAFQTGLLSYFTHRDFFPALMKVNTVDCYGIASDCAETLLVYERSRYKRSGIRAIPVAWNISEL